jgi:hypothetical protein
MNTMAATGTNCYQHTKPARVGGNPVGRAGIGRTPAAENPEIAALAERFQQREEVAHLYVEAYRRYCWPVHSLPDLEVAPFQYSPASQACTPRITTCGIWRCWLESATLIPICCSRRHSELWISPTKRIKKKESSGGRN